MGKAELNSVEFDPFEIINSIPSMTILEELKVGHNTFSILLLTPQGRVIYANDIAVNGFSGHTVETIRGKSLHDFVPKEWMAERMMVMDKAVQSKRQVIFIEIIEGVRLCSRLKAIDAIINNIPVPVILYTIEPIISRDFEWIKTRTDNFEVIMAQCVDLGKLNILSDRELEVLALMGQGMRQKDIAKELCRSVSTINRHRESIGNKLNMTDRAQIVRLAGLAVLQVEDASKKRFTLNPNSPARIDSDHCG